MRLKILLIGKNGQVGWELQSTLAGLGELVATDRQTLDLSQPHDIRKAIRSLCPEIIVNAAAYTAVDKAESEQALAMTINGEAPGTMAEEAKRLNCLLVHFSTDYVFDGTKSTPYVESDTPNPLNAYGRSKLAGEQAIQQSGVQHLIFRTSWIYSDRGSNFALTMKRLFREKQELRIVDDQIGAPTRARDVAEGTAKAVNFFRSQTKEGRDQLRGLYHLTATGATSWYAFAKEIAVVTGLNAATGFPDICAIKTMEYRTEAQRPLNSVLSSDKFCRSFGFSLPHWSESLRKSLLNAANSASDANLA